MLLERAVLPVGEAIGRLVGLQAQLAQPPYVGLWTRLREFRRQQLATEIENRNVVKATLMRATLHLVTADDYVKFRATLQPMLEGTWSALAKQRGANLDRDRLLKGAREYIAEKPRTFAEISRRLAALMPGHDIGAMRYAVRTHLPLVQVPIPKGWSYSGKPEFALAESWIGRSLSAEERVKQLILRYLAAFGPASATDMQTWSGLSNLKDVFDAMKPELRSYRSEQRVELFDLPGLSLPSGDVPAPVRFLPEFDNLLLSHRNRTRVIADQHRSRVYLPGLRVRATILVDGFVGGAWKIEKASKAATLVIEPFEALSKRDRKALAEEGERLVRFAVPGAKSIEVQFES